MIYRDKAVQLYVFGSRAEGTTTEGLESDRDVLECYEDIELIQEIDQATGEQFTMYGYIFKDEKTHPGYVKLQLCAHDLPLSSEHTECFRSLAFYRNLISDEDRLLLSNNYGRMKYSCDEINGPARTDIISTTKYHTTLDRIFALKCDTWPSQASNWFMKPAREFWPHTRIQHLIRRFGCFVTPVGHIESESNIVEWRLSLSEAERYLIWSLNETQFKCIVMMKILTKQFIKSRYPDSITSYHCKNVVFSVIETTEECLWHPRNFVQCVNMCLLRLLQFVDNGYIPQYFIPENNLLKHKLNRTNRKKVANIIRSMLENHDYRYFLSVEIDNINGMLVSCFSGLGYSITNARQERIKHLICTLVLPIMGQFAYWRGSIFSEQLVVKHDNSPRETLSCVITKHFKLLSQLQKSVIEFNTIRSFSAAGLMDLMTSHLLSSLGHHLLALGTIQCNVQLDEQTQLFHMGFRYIREGYQDDNISNGLKIAHVLYRCGLFKEALCRLEHIEEKLVSPNRRQTIQICKCRDMTQQISENDIEILSTHSLESSLGNVTAHCVFYLGTELMLTPKALVYELFRSSGYEIEIEGCYDNWMRHAVVDPAILLFYLQFICFRELGDVHSQDKALLNITMSIADDQNLGHTETALNILGHCFMEQACYGEALNCFVRSLSYDIRCNTDKYPSTVFKHHIKQLHHHNAAKIHLCVLISHLLRLQADKQNTERVD